MNGNGLGLHDERRRPQDSDRERIEIELLLEGVYRVYGYDFRDYAYPSLKRRIWHQVHEEKVDTISELQGRILYNRDCLQRFVRSLSIPVTEMFRDPSMFLAFRQQVVPMLRTYPYIRIWHAGCSTGEEVYSMAILLHEEGLYEKTRLYATDMNPLSLQKAKEGVCPMDKMRTYTKNYLEAGGTSSFSEYYTASGEGVVIHPYLRKNVIFAEHNLATDRSFNEFNVILCRNVMIYFNEPLRNRVHDLFYESLAPLGVLIVGGKESLHFTGRESQYEEIDRNEKIYRKIR
ncbi:mcp methyltransferase, cher-type [Paenibacillus alvei TS-15]|uniref:Mcp methyltransferase, cher-type n=1 Tax=Paenibacillus alvei TS-15 TaxID=1117108 RepID=S9TS05_PAEAL|nr:protein-glutamate O-methyltransferase CheR [Paenibacillus alvei]EPY05066.1 mcp methyltransferase, cher-type [Paenibacillus alvei TS-15]